MRASEILTFLLLILEINKFTGREFMVQDLMKSSGFFPIYGIRVDFHNLVVEKMNSRHVL